MRDKIIKILLSVGVTPDLSGFEKIVSAIEIKSKENVGMTKVYNRLATDTSYANVERQIRHAISKTDKKSVESLFGTKIPTNKEYFTNEQFIALCALKIKEG